MIKDVTGIWEIDMYPKRFDDKLCMAIRIVYVIQINGEPFHDFEIILDADALIKLSADALEKLMKGLQNETL